MLEREINISQRQYDWPDNYYMETSPATRKKYLDEAMAENPSEENKLRLLLWQKRYADAKGQIVGYDHYLKVWTDMVFAVKEGKGLFGKKRVRKFQENMMDVFQLELLKDKPEYRHVWLREFLNFCCFYIQISKSDKNYSTTLFGIGKLSDESLALKLAEDLCLRTVTYPKQLDMYEAQEVLAEAAKHAFLLYFPEKEGLYDRIYEKA